MTFLPEECLQRHADVDYVVLYDAEVSFADLVDALQSRAVAGKLAGVAGLAFRDGAGIVVTPPTPPVRDLDRYGRPDRSLFDMQRYLKYDYETVVMTARGCPSRCAFCSTTQIGRKYRWNSVDHVCDELEEVLGLGFTSIFFGDDTFSGNADRMIQFCQEVRRRRLDFRWTSNMRALDARSEVLAAMREAGAYRVFVGFESIQEQTLRMMKKGTRAQELPRTAELIQSYDIELHASFVIGAPEDTHESLEATLDFIRLLNPTVATFNVMEPRPGTDVYHNPARYGIYIPDPYWYETSDWVDGPVCFNNDLTAADIREWVNRCYDEFCTREFRDPAKLE